MSKLARSHTGPRAQEESRCGTLGFIAVQKPVQKHVFSSSCESSSTFTRGIPIRRIESPCNDQGRHDGALPDLIVAKSQNSTRIRDRQPTSCTSNKVKRIQPLEHNATHCIHLPRPSSSFLLHEKYTIMTCLQAHVAWRHRNAFNSREETRTARILNLFRI